MKKSAIDKLLWKKIKQADSIIIAKHKNPDWDAQGSAMGLAWIIKENAKKGKKIYVVGERLNDDKHFSAEHLTDETVANSLLITVDTAAKKLIDFDRVLQAREIFKIDHHLEADPFGTYNMVNPQAIANTQIITLWAKRMGLDIPQKGAENLYKGLVTDSGRFLFPRTGVDTYNAAIDLVETGIDLEKIHNSLYVAPLNMKRWQNEAFSTMKVSKKGVAYIQANFADYDKYHLNKGEVKSALGTMAGIEEIVIWAMITELESGDIRVSLRSREYDVNSVAKNFEGGGHKLAAGAKLQKMSDTPKLIAELDKLVKK